MSEMREPELESVETLADRIGAAVSERQRLRADAADPQALERNRLEIVRLQWTLSRALIARYGPEQSAA